MIRRLLPFVVLLLFLSSCSLRHVVQTGYYPYPVMKSVQPGYTQEGIASWYGPNFHGKRTANGEIYNMYAHTAASKTLPFNTIVKVINLNNGRSTIVRINDRGPFVKNRIIDLSYAAARDLGMIGTGTAPVKIIVLGNAKNYNPQSNAYTTNTVQQPSMEELEHIDIDTNIGVDTQTVAVKFAIQFGAFRNLYNAIKLRDRLSRFFKGVYIERKTIRGDVFYRVLLGSFDTKDAALEYASKYVNPITSSFIISKR